MRVILNAKGDMAEASARLRIAARAIEPVPTLGDSVLVQVVATKNLNPEPGIQRFALTPAHEIGWSFPHRLALARVYGRGMALVGTMAAHAVDAVTKERGPLGGDSKSMWSCAKALGLSNVMEQPAISLLFGHANFNWLDHAAVPSPAAHETDGAVFEECDAELFKTTQKIAPDFESRHTAKEISAVWNLLAEQCHECAVGDGDHILSPYDGSRTAAATTRVLAKHDAHELAHMWAAASPAAKRLPELTLDALRTQERLEIAAAEVRGTPPPPLPTRDSSNPNLTGATRL